MLFDPLGVWWGCGESAVQFEDCTSLIPTPYLKINWLALNGSRSYMLNIMMCPRGFCSIYCALATPHLGNLMVPGTLPGP